MEIKRGVYFLANNRVYDLAIAFLNSFREHNKEIYLCLIPYDQNAEKIYALKEDYNFTIFKHEKILGLCDDISTMFHEKQLGAYRKLAAWEGDFDEFVYIDLDTIVLESIDFVFEYLSTYPIFTSHSNLPGMDRWVWNPSIFKKNILYAEQIKYSANTGFFVSKKKILSINIVLEKASSALALREDMFLLCMEQPFLNYLIVTSGYNYSSLSEIRWRNRISKIKLECWAGSKGGVVEQGKFYIPFRPNFFLLHWAGLWQKNNGDVHAIPYKNLWIYYRNINPKYALLLDDVKCNETIFFTFLLSIRKYSFRIFESARRLVFKIFT